MDPTAQRVNQWVPVRRVGAGNGDVTIVRDRRFPMAHFPPGLGRLFIAECMDGAGTAGGLLLVGAGLGCAQTPDPRLVIKADLSTTLWFHIERYRC